MHDNKGRFYRLSPGGSSVVEEPPSGEIDPAAWYRTGDRVRRAGEDLVHLGRTDFQVKIRGYRVDLGEVETVLRRHPAITGTAVVTCRAADGETELRAAYAGEAVREEDLRAHLLRSLPAYMVPDEFRRLEVIPLNANGKIDRRGIASLLEA